MQLRLTPAATQQQSSQGCCRALVNFMATQAASQLLPAVTSHRRQQQQQQQQQQQENLCLPAAVLLQNLAAADISCQCRSPRTRQCSWTARCQALQTGPAQCWCRTC